jgi:hypothetical protein
MSASAFSRSQGGKPSANISASSARDTAGNEGRLLLLLLLLLLAMLDAVNQQERVAKIKILFALDL